MAAPDRRFADGPEEEPPEPPRLRALRLMVVALTATLILGVVAVAAALVIRVARVESAAPIFDAAPFDAAALGAERIALPEGETVSAVGAAGGALLFVTRDAAGAERLRVYDAETGAALHEAAIAREGG